MPQILQLNRQTDGESNPVTWVDLDLRDNDTADWIEHESGLSAEVKHSMLKSDELSRREVYDDGMLICIHTQKIQPTAGQNDSLSSRIWIEPDRLITVRSEASSAMMRSVPPRRITRNIGSLIRSWCFCSVPT